MNQNGIAVRTAALTVMAVLGTTLTARAQGVQPLQPKGLPAFTLPTEPTEASAAETRGRVAYLSGDFSGAIFACTRLIKLRPDDAQAHFNRGLAELAADQNSAAERDFTSYLSTQSRNRYDERALTGYLQRGRARAAQGRFDEAFADFSRVLEGQRPYHTDMDVARKPRDLFAFALMSRAAARYQAELNPASLSLSPANTSSHDRNAMYAAVLADYDKALMQTGLRPEQAIVARFNRALILETRAADGVATPNAEAATVGYAGAIKEYEAYLGAATNTTDAAHVKEHIAQIGIWLVADKKAARPVMPAAFALKAIP